MTAVTLALGVLLQAVFVSPAARLVAEGDSAFARLEYPAAIASYEGALQDAPRDAGALWRLARAYVVMAEATEMAERVDYVRKAEMFARKCVAADSSNAYGHTWLAGSLGFAALDAGMKDQARLSRELLAETETALRLNPSDDVAYSIRGSFYRALGNVGWLKRQLAALFIGSIPGGGFEESESALKRAIALAPEVMRHRYELGVLYLDQGRDAEARQSLEDAMRLPVRVTSDIPRVKKIRELLRDSGK